MADNAEQEQGELKFEVENRSAAVASLAPHITCKYYYVSKLRIKKGHNSYFVRASQRQLPPFNPIVLTATPETHPPLYAFSWFRTYTFRPTRGLRARVRIRNALLEQVGAVRFLWELARFRLTGDVRPDPHSTIDQLDALKRSQGPH